MSEQSTVEQSSTSARNRAALERARTVSYVMDDALRIPGTGFRIGLDPVLGIVPVSGDAIAALGSLYIVLQGFRIGVPGRTLATMLLLVAVEFLVGSIPVLGTILDAVIKVNKRNTKTLESYLETPNA